MQKKTLLIVFLIKLLLFSSTTYAQGLSYQTEILKLEKEKLAFQKQNESDKNRIEVIKSVITSIAVVLPLLIAIYSVRSQIKITREMKQIEINSALLLKATELSMDAKSPYEVKAKAKVIKEILKQNLPDDFVESLNPQSYSKPGPGFANKFELFKLISDNPEKEKAIIDLWLRMFPGDSIDMIFPKKNEAPQNTA